MMGRIGNHVIAALVIIADLFGSPVAMALDVNGELKKAQLEKLSSDPSAWEARIYWNTTDKAAKIYNGSAWSAVGAGGSSGINLIANPNAEVSVSAGTMADVGSGTTVSRTTTSTEIPLYPSKAYAIKIENDGSGTGSTRIGCFQVPESLKNMTLGVSAFQAVGAGYVAGDFTLDIYSDTASDCSGTETRLTLSTDDTTPKTTLAAYTGPWVPTSFDTTSADYYELRVTRAAGSSGATSWLSLNEVTVGPDIAVQGSFFGPWTTYTPATSVGFGTISLVDAKYRQVGDSVELQVRFLAGTVTASTASIALPTGLTTASTGNLKIVGQWIRGNGDASQVKRGPVMMPTTSQNYVNFSKDEYAGGSNPFAALPGTSLAATGEVFGFFATVPVSELAGAVTVSAQNECEYACVTGTWDAASTTTQYGQSGCLMGGTLTDRRMKTITWLSSIQPSDRVQLWGSQNNVQWVPLLGAALGPSNVTVIGSMDTTGAELAGVNVRTSSTSTSQVEFKQYMSMANDDSPGINWPSASAYWIATKCKAGQTAGFNFATGTRSGLVSTTTQTFAGDKDFNDDVNVDGTLAVTGATTLTGGVAISTGLTLGGNETVTTYDEAIVAGVGCAEAAFTSESFSVNLVRLGPWVSMVLVGDTSFSVGSGSNCTLSAILPASFRPSVTQRYPLRCTSNGTIKTCMMSVLTSGSLEFSDDLGGGNFDVGAGGIDPAGFSWNTL